MGAIALFLGKPIDGRENQHYDAVTNMRSMLDDLVASNNINGHRTYFPNIGGQEPWSAVTQIEAPTDALYKVLQDSGFQERLATFQFTCGDVQTQVWEGGTGDEEEQVLNRTRNAGQTLGYL